MADQVKSKGKEADIRFSAFMRLSTSVALGSLATVGLGVYLLVGSILKNLGQQTPLAYVLTVLFFAPVILVLAERAAVMRGRGSIFKTLLMLSDSSVLTGNSDMDLKPLSMGLPPTKPQIWTSKLPNSSWILRNFCAFLTGRRLTSEAAHN